MDDRLPLDRPVIPGQEEIILGLYPFQFGQECLTLQVRDGPGGEIHDHLMDPGQGSHGSLLWVSITRVKVSL